MSEHLLGLGHTARPIPAGTRVVCKDSRCRTVIATFRVDRTTGDPARREDMIFPAAWPMPAEGSHIRCPVCQGPGKLDLPEQNLLT